MFAFFTPGPMEIFIVLALILFLFGASKLPKIAQSIGKSFFSLKKGMAEGEKEYKQIKKEIVEGVTLDEKDTDVVSPGTGDGARR